MLQLVSILTSHTEFWAAVTGAIVGAIVSGLIAFCIQYKVLREARQIRAEDRRTTQQAVATALIFKIGRIYSNVRSLHKHLEECFGTADGNQPQHEAWQVFLPIANLPDRISFTTDEMGMLLAMNNDRVFGLVLALDDVHNSHLSTVRTLQEEHAQLRELISLEGIEGNVGKITLDRAAQLKLRPRMINVNQISEQLRADAKRTLDESKEALAGAHKLLCDKLELSFGLEFIGSESK